MSAKAHRLSDGNTVSIRTERTIAGTYFHEVTSRKRPTSTLMLLDGRMFLLMRKNIVPISHPDYSYAGSDKVGAQVALRFFVESAESTIAHAAAEGIDVGECY